MDNFRLFLRQNGQTLNFRLFDEQTVNGLKKNAWSAIFHLKQQYMYMYIYIVPVSKYIYTENGPNGKGQLLFACCKRKTETPNFRLFAANGNGSLLSLVSK
jgi:hypothetical protein